MRHKRLTYDPVNHLYKIDGKPVTGTTTALSLFQSDFNSIKKWVARMTAEAMIRGVREAEPKVTLKNLKEVAKMAISAHIEELEKSGERGKYVHEEIKKIVREAIGKNKGRIMAKDRHSDQRVTKFLMWSRENKWVWHHSEKMVYSETAWVAGRFDLVGTQGTGKDKKTYMVDIKTGGVYDRTPFAQLANYRRCYEEIGMNPAINAQMVLRLTDKEGRVKKSDVLVSEHYKDDLDLFNACLSVYRNINNFKLGNTGKRKKGVDK